MALAHENFGKNANSIFRAWQRLTRSRKMPGETSVKSSSFWHPCGVHLPLGPVSGGRFAKSPKRPPATICNPFGIGTPGTCLGTDGKLGCLARDFSTKDEDKGSAAPLWISVKQFTQLFNAETQRRKDLARQSRNQIGGIKFCQK
jgi:hypothetical protein